MLFNSTRLCEGSQVILPQGSASEKRGSTPSLSQAPTVGVLHLAPSLTPSSEEPPLGEEDALPD